MGKGLDCGDKQLDALISRAHDKREAAGENNTTLVETEWGRTAERLRATRRATNAALTAEHHRRLADVSAGFSASPSR